MNDPKPGNVVTVFRSRLAPGVDDEYAAMAAEVFELARLAPGFVSIEDFTSADGERLALVVFEDLESQQAWRNHSRHVAAQQQGRQRFYTEYSVAVCECLRAHRGP